MGPNVYGMALFSDGGIFATKPYICGSNYYKKMGGYREGSWQAGVDGLYWSFIERNRKFFVGNHRLSMMVKLLDKIPVERKTKLFTAADELKERITRVSRVEAKME
jgi:deoxyribodipyrimidine photolyase-related protein